MIISGTICFGSGGREMEFVTEKCPDTFLPEDRICRGCWKMSSESAVRAVGTNYLFAACSEFECQEAVKSQILASLASCRKPSLMARIFSHVFY